LGEVIRFFERVADEFAELDDGETVDVECAVTVEAVLRQGEGTLIVSAELSEDGFILSETSNDYDSYSRRHFAWEPCFGIEFNDCHEWRETFLDVLRQGYLSIERLDD
jgi:hypothetical protein